VNELTFTQRAQVSGALAPLVYRGVGALAGGVGGFFGVLASEGSDASGMDLLKGTISGMAVGAASPVGGFRTAAKNLLGGVAAGGVSGEVEQIVNSIENRPSLR